MYVELRERARKGSENAMLGAATNMHAVLFSRLFWNE